MSFILILTSPTSRYSQMRLKIFMNACLTNLKDTPFPLLNFDSLTSVGIIKSHEYYWYVPPPKPSLFHTLSNYADMVRCDTTKAAFVTTGSYTSLVTTTVTTTLQGKGS